MKKNILFALLVFAALFFLVTLSCYPLCSEDVFMDLSLARYFFNHGSLPTTDPFLLQSGLSMPVHHAWLTYFIFYGLHFLGGFGLITLLKVVMILLIFILPLLTFKNRHFFFNFIWGICTLLAAYAACFRFMERSFLFSDLLTIVVLNLYLYVRKNSSKWQYAIPLVFLFWVNVHPGYPAGWLIALIALIVDWKKFREKNYQKLCGISALSFLVTLINPRGWAGMMFPFSFSPDINEMRKYNYEWMKTINPLFLEHLQTTFIPLLLLLIIFLAVLIMYLKKNRSQWPWFEMGVFILFFGLGLTAVRFVSLLSYVTLTLACSLASALDVRKKTAETCIALITIVFLGWGIKNIIYGYDIVGAHRTFGLGLDPHLAPEKAADFVDHLSFEGNVFNTQVLGGYLVWKWNEKRPIFYDGFVIDANFFNKIYSGFANKDAFPTLVERYHIGVIILDRFIGIEPFLKVLSKHPEWRLAYQDEGALVYTLK